MSFDNAFIGYNNYFTATASTLTASGVDTGFNINSLKNWQAFDYVQLPAAQTTPRLIAAVRLISTFLPFAPMNYSLKTVLPSQLKAQVMWLLAQVPHSQH